MPIPLEREGEGFGERGRLVRRERKGEKGQR
jgi:hypothetical protein